MESQDVITYNQQIVKVIEEEKTLKILKDENLLPVLKILQKGPMTIADLVEFFKKSGEEKSDKTIYRYLHKLIQVKLVAKAGKRIVSVTEENLKSETLYMRSARIFIFPESLKHEEDNYEKRFCPIFDVSRLLMKPFFEGKTLDSNKYQEFQFELNEKRNKLLVELIENTNEEAIQGINSLEWKCLENFLSYLSWIAISTKVDIEKELNSLIESWCKMTSQDVITYKPKKLVFLKDSKRSELFEDENLSMVIKFLKKGPMTITDLMQSFKNIGLEKSDKSIYRYLHKLIQGKLVAKAGKRITAHDETDLTSETLYMRTSDAFILKIDLSKEENGELKSPVFETLYHVFKQLHENKEGDIEAFKEFFDKMDKEKDEYIFKLFEEADKETYDKLAELDGKEILFALDYAAWLGILMKYNMKEELAKIYS